jgi:nicotinate (nicotinamide) nucleotide adenylyltransferase
MNKLKIGFFGGCFNPPTIAHIELAKLAIKQANLDKLIFIPMGNCYPKKDLVDIKHRYEMLKIAIKNEKKMEISNMQFDQIAVTYAIDSFLKIEQNYDVIYVDPPYYSGVYLDVFANLYNIIGENTIIIAEHNEPLELEHFSLLKEKKYGDKFVTFWKKLNIA